MNLRQMEVFNAIMVTGTVTAAAKMLNISQPSVTGVLRHTEDRLKFKLFERVRGRLRPTPEAQALFGQVQHVFDGVDVVHRTINGLREARSGTLDIVAIPVVGATLLPGAIGAFLASRENIAVRYQMRARNEVMEMVASGAADLGFGFLSSDFPRLKVREIARRNLICIMPKGHPLSRQRIVSINDLTQHPLISYTSNQGLAPLIHAALIEARVNFRPNIEVGLIINAWAMVNAGAGVAIVDDHSALQSMFPKVATRPLLPEIPIALELITSEDRPLSVIGNAFVKHFARYLKRDTD